MLVSSPFHITIPVVMLVIDIFVLEMLKKKWAKDKDATPEMKKARKMLGVAMIYSGVIMSVFLYLVLSGQLQQWLGATAEG